MHFHADHPLFFESRQSVRVTAAYVASTFMVVVVNSGARSLPLSAVLGLAGAALLVSSDSAGWRRLGAAVALGAALVSAGAVAQHWLEARVDLIVETTVRILTGVVWILWLGSRIDWAALRRLLLWMRVPAHVVGTLDQALLHGILTRREWARRRDAARLRTGSPRLALSAWGPLLGEGALSAFHRLEQAEQNTSLRSARPESRPTDGGIALDSVDLERNGLHVLERLTLRVNRGEWLLLCGASGAGKSSLLRLLAGLDAPSGGSLTRFGSRIGAKASLRSRLDGRVALLSQNPEHHFIASTVAEDIAWGLLRRDVDPEEAQRRCHQMARSLRIDHLLLRPCHQLSFGEQRRVALAGLLVLEPDILLLDEPTAGLDPVAAYELRTLVEDCLHRSGAICVWATHDLHALPPSASRVVLLHGRRLLFDGPTSVGLTEPWLVRAGLATAAQKEPSC